MKATAGNWDPDVRGIYFTAGGSNADAPNRYTPPSANLFAVNDFAAKGRAIVRSGTAWDQFNESLDNGCPTFLDSGIFNLTNEHMRAHGTTMDEALALAPEEIDGFDWLYDVYGEMCREFGGRLWGYNELDQGGRDNKIRTRARLESEGLAPIPVYHPLNDGWGYFDDLALEYDRICWGNVVQASRAARLRLVATAFERHRQYPDLFIHFLGLTPCDMQATYPFDSCDSSTWTVVFRYPASARTAVMGWNQVNMPERFWPPFAADLIESARPKMGDYSAAEIRFQAANLELWHQELHDEFGHDRYYLEAT